MRHVRAAAGRARLRLDGQWQLLACFPEAAGCTQASLSIDEHTLSDSCHGECCWLMLAYSLCYARPCT